MTADQYSAPAGPPEALLRIISQLESFLVVSHTNPDGDAIGSSLAMGRFLEALGKQVVIMLDSPIPAIYEFLTDSDRIYLPERFEQSLKVSGVIALECPNMDRMGRVKERLSGNESIICIDHHLDSVQYGEINWIDIGYSSVGEMLWDLFKIAEYDIDEAGAEQLYTAVMTDTGRFRFDNTTSRTMRCTSELIAAGAKPEKISREVYFTTRPSTLKLQGLVLHDIRFEADDRICHLSLTNRMLQEAGADKSEAEGLIDYTLFSRGVQLGAMFKEHDELTTRVSLRSADNINVARIAKEFSGGGHFHAAGFDFNGPLDQARETVLGRLREALDGH